MNLIDFFLSLEEDQNLEIRDKKIDLGSLVEALDGNLSSNNFNKVVRVLSSTKLDIGLRGCRRGLLTLKESDFQNEHLIPYIENKENDWLLLFRRKVFYVRDGKYKRVDIGDIEYNTIQERSIYILWAFLGYNDGDWFELKENSDQIVIGTTSDLWGDEKKAIFRISIYGEAFIIYFENSISVKVCRVL